MEPITGKLEIYYLEYDFNIKTEIKQQYSGYSTDISFYTADSEIIDYLTKIECYKVNIELDGKYRDKLVSGDISIIYEDILKRWDNEMSNFKYANYNDDYTKNKYYISFDDVMKFHHNIK